MARAAAAPTLASAAPAVPSGTLFFIENRGQRQGDIAFYGAGKGKSLAFAAGGIQVTTVEPAEVAGTVGVARMASPKSALGPSDAPARRRAPRSLAVDGRFGLLSGFTDSSVADRSVRRRTAELTFVGARAGVRPEGRDRQSTIVSYFKGPRASWRTGLATFGRIVYPDLWSGIDLEFVGTAAGVTPQFVIRPGADPAAIHLAWSGEVAAPTGWNLETTSSLTSPIGRLDDSKSIVLAAEPVITAYAGYFGYGGEEDRALGIATDETGHAYVTGQILEDGEDLTDAFIAKLKLDGRGLDYLAIIGGDDGDGGFDIDVDKTGNAYITGFTASDQDSFPVTMGPDLTPGGVADALVAKLDPGGQDLVYAGFLGGELIDFGEGIRVDDAGNVYLHGIVLSSAATFPVKVGPDRTFNDETDAFVCKVKAEPSAPDVLDNLDYCGYLGGDASDIQMQLDGTSSFYSSGHIAVDAAGAVYVSGETTSAEATFPDGDGFGSLPGPDRTQGGMWDAYVVKVKPDGSGLVYAGYVGGAADDWGKGMTVDTEGNAYLTGGTGSDESTLPVTVGPDLTYNGGELDGLVAKVKANGSGFAYLGYLGGDDTDDGEAVVVDAAGRLSIVGYVESKAETFPAKEGPDLSQNDMEDGAGDAYVARIKAVPSDPDPRANLDFAGYIGGAKSDQAFWVDIDAAGDAYVVGDTESDEQSFPDGNGLADRPSWNDTLDGTHDGFVVKVRTGGPALPTARPTEAPSSTPAPTSTPGAAGHKIFLPVGVRSAALGAGAAAASLSIDGPGRYPAMENGLRLASPLRASLVGQGERRREGTVRATALQLQETSYDDFCDFGIGWAWSDTADIKAHITADNLLRCYYQMKILKKSEAYGAFSGGHRAEGNFALETVVDIRGKGTLAGPMFGVGNDFSLWYAYLISDAGEYYLAKSTNGSTTALASGPVDFDPAEPVKLMVAVQGSSIQLFVNGDRIDEVTDSGSHNGRVGIYTEWDGTGGASLENRFDYIRISRITGSSE